jgi:hypothetical protein
MVRVEVLEMLECLGIGWKVDKKGGNFLKKKYLEQNTKTLSVR